MWQAVREGILLGLTLSVMIGPVFFTLVNVTLHSGARTAMIFDAGVVASDIVLMFVTFFGIDAITNSTEIRQFIGYAGSAILFFSGMKMLLSERTLVGRPISDLSRKDMFKLFYAGAAINTLNPFTIIFWIGVAAFISAKQINEPAPIFVFYAFVVLTVAATDLGKIYFSKKLSTLLDQRVINIFGKVSGLILCIFAVRLFYFTWQIV
jgi:threonine/homoserine/homoserine lactone efflux protein